MMNFINEIKQDLGQLFENHAVYKPKRPLHEDADQAERLIQRFHEAVAHKCEGWFDFLQQRLLNSSRSKYRHVIGLDQGTWKSLKERLKPKYEIRGRSLTRINEDSDELCDIFATTLFLKPLAKVQKLKVFVPNSKKMQGSTDSSIGKMYEW